MIKQLIDEGSLTFGTLTGGIFVGQTFQLIEDGAAVEIWVTLANNDSTDRSIRFNLFEGVPSDYTTDDHADGTNSLVTLTGSVEGTTPNIAKIPISFNFIAGTQYCFTLASVSNSGGGDVGLQVRTSNGDEYLDGSAWHFVQGSGWSEPGGDLVFQVHYLTGNEKTSIINTSHGIDVLSSDIKDRLYTTSAQSLKLHDFGTVTFTATGAGATATVTFGPPLGYIPVYRVFCQTVPGSGKWFIDTNLADNIDIAQSVPACNFVTSVSEFELQVQFSGMTIGQSYKFRFYIFKDRLVGF